VLDVAVKEATMNDNPGEVSGNMVKKVLEVGIETADVDVLRRGLQALSVPIDRGMGLQVRGGRVCWLVGLVDERWAGWLVGWLVGRLCVHTCINE
jgi:hypothetical protein